MFGLLYRTFCRWLVDHSVATAQGGVNMGYRLNSKLESENLEPMTDLVKDFSTGVKLIQVLPSTYLHFITLMY